MRTTLLLTVVGCGCPGCVSGCVCVWGVCVCACVCAGGVCPGVRVSSGGGCPGCVCVQVCVCVCVSGYHTDTPITIKAKAIP